MYVDSNFLLRLSRGKSKRIAMLFHTRGVNVETISCRARPPRRTGQTGDKRLEDDLAGLLCVYAPRVSLSSHVIVLLTDSLLIISTEVRILTPTPPDVTACGQQERKLTDPRHRASLHLCVRLSHRSVCSNNQATDPEIGQSHCVNRRRRISTHNGTCFFLDCHNISYPSKSANFSMIFRDIKSIFRFLPVVLLRKKHFLCYLVYLSFICLLYPSFFDISKNKGNELGLFPRLLIFHLKYSLSGIFQCCWRRIATLPIPIKRK